MHHFKIKAIKCQLFWRKSTKFTTSHQNDQKKPSEYWMKERHWGNKAGSYLCNKSQKVTLLIVICACKPSPPRVPSARSADHWGMEDIHWKASLVKSELVSQRIRLRNLGLPVVARSFKGSCNKVLQPWSLNKMAAKGRFSPMLKAFITWHCTEGGRRPQRMPRTLGACPEPPG